MGSKVELKAGDEAGGDGAITLSRVVTDCVRLMVESGLVTPVSPNTVPSGSCPDG